jgi:hypothetical protein
VVPVREKGEEIGKARQKIVKLNSKGEKSKKNGRGECIGIVFFCERDNKYHLKRVGGGNMVSDRYIDLCWYGKL